MPVYNAVIPVQGSERGVAKPLWTAETPAPGAGGAAASQQYGLEVRPNSGRMPFSIDGKFSGAPGVFEIDVQVAAVDADANYQTISGGNITAVDAANNTWHFDAPTVIARFARLLLRARANVVSVTATITNG